jgi:cysteine synthase
VLVGEIRLVAEAEAFAMCRRLARQEGLLVGISSGATVEAAMQFAERSVSNPVIGCVLADTGQRNLSVEGLFDA